MRTDELAALQEERDFLLSSLNDLEQEHTAGDVDEDDYVTLRDDYTARAAQVLRAIESRSTRQIRPASSSKPMWQRAAAVAGVAAFALGAGLLVREASGRRGAGDTLTGNVGDSTANRFEEALVLGREGRYAEAIAVYDDILADDPGDVQAATYRGWNLFLSGKPEEALPALVEASGMDPEYPDVHAFLAVLFNRLGQDDVALQALDRLEELDPPPEILEMVAPLRAELEGATTATTATTAAP